MMVKYLFGYLTSCSAATVFTVFEDSWLSYPCQQKKTSSSGRISGMRRMKALTQGGGLVATNLLSVDVVIQAKLALIRRSE